MKKGKITFKVLGIAFILAIAAFTIILVIETSILKNYEKVNVVVASKDITEGTHITETNRSQYFEVMEIPKDFLQENALESLDDIDDYIVSYSMQKQEQLTKNKMLNITSDILKEYDEPVEVSIDVDSISKAVSGTLREGDRVDIVARTIDGADSSYNVIMSDVYISGTYDASGKPVTVDGDNINSVVFTVIIEREQYIELINGIKDGGVQLIKVTD